jgi:hypothetical protein
LAWKFAREQILEKKYTSLPLLLKVLEMDVSIGSLRQAARNEHGGSSLICKEGCRFSMGWCMREPYCPLSSAVCNATISTLPLFEMAESAFSPFCYVLHYLLFIKFTSVFITYA